MYGFVTERIIDGKVYTVWRHTTNPKDEKLVCNGEAVAVKAKEIVTKGRDEIKDHMKKGKKEKFNVKYQVGNVRNNH